MCLFINYLLFISLLINILCRSKCCAVHISISFVNVFKCFDCLGKKIIMIISRQSIQTARFNLSIYISYMAFLVESLF